ncbi:Glycosyl transferases group 1 [Lachnospiraceae bacterium G11]|nr:Glycosyl transferases group 1 [Lachnospiraceae bacterium G11]
MSEFGRYTLLFLNDEHGYKLPKELYGEYELKEVDLTTGKDKHYGTLYPLMDAVRSIKSEYLVMNINGTMPELTDELVEKLVNHEADYASVKVFYRNRIQESYRSVHYGYDYRMILSILKRDFPKIYEFYTKRLVDTYSIFSWGGIFRTEIVKEALDFTAKVLKVCTTVLPDRYSIKQNLYCQNLAPYLFSIYLSYNEEKYVNEECEKLKLEMDNPDKDDSEELLNKYKDASRSEILKAVDDYIRERDLEKAAHLIIRILKDKEDIYDIRDAFIRYEKERRYYKETFMDDRKARTEYLRKPIKPESIGIKNGKPKMLVYVWNSIGNDSNIQAFEDFGFEVSTVQMPFNIMNYSEELVDQINVHMDKNDFDLAYSLNCNPAVAEACYIHDTPYIGWCYDSPSYTGSHWYLHYPTTHVFAFDSSDAENYQKGGIKQAYYLPLAANLKAYDKVIPKGDDFTKFAADISFIGSLYDTPLPEAMGYLNDYQKGYINALLDNQMDVYGHSFYAEIVSGKMTKWLDNEDFNRLINWDKSKRDEEIPSDIKEVNPGTLNLILNKQVTNKERLLLLNLLAAHHEVKLYSYKENPALKGLKFCGTANYYTEAPKIFRLSKLNLNATLRSIRNGIPLRCIDIMGCHGALLTNYQKDFDDHFVDGQNVIFYTSAEEALEKANFYLSHETERQKIADAGYETIKEYYDYPVKIKEMFTMSGLEYLIPKKSR